MRYLLDILYFIVFVTLTLLSAVWQRRFSSALWSFTRNFWGTSLPKLDGRPVVWLHAVSVGESLICQALIKRLGIHRPDLQPVVSVGTRDGLEVARRDIPEAASFPAPADFSWSIRRAFASVRPVALLIAENDFWPNLLNEARMREIPLGIFNTRMTRKEIVEHRINAWLLRPGLQRARWWGTVAESDANRIMEFFHVTRPRLEVTGSLKFDGTVRDPSQDRTQSLCAQIGIQPHDRVLMAGSTHPGEEELLAKVAIRLTADFPEFRLVIAPRDISRCPAIQKIFERQKLECRLASEFSTTPPATTIVTLLDSIGQLRDAWGFANFAFVGGSLVPRGGHNMIEPASFGVPVCFGPHVWDFQSPADDFLSAGAAVQIPTIRELESTIRRWLQCRVEAEQMGRRAQEFVRTRTEPLERTVRGILSMLPPDMHLRADALLASVNLPVENRQEVT